MFKRRMSIAMSESQEFVMCIQGKHEESKQYGWTCNGQAEDCITLYFCVNNNDNVSVVVPVMHFGSLPRWSVFLGFIIFI